MESIGFKEWAVICEALGRGRQSIILRKGGISEGRDGFSFKHQEFFLFPTWFHEQPAKVIELRDEIPEPNDEVIEIKYGATPDIARTITSWSVAEALAPLHILQPGVIRERFDYDQAPGLHIALVRVFRLSPVWKFPNDAKYGGCRSWVKLPDIPNGLRFEPVLSDAEHEKRLNEFSEIVKGDVVKPAPSA